MRQPIRQWLDKVLPGWKEMTPAEREQHLGRMYAESKFRGLYHHGVSSANAGLEVVIGTLDGFNRYTHVEV